jgi:hypothetical protein
MCLATLSLSLHAQVSGSGAPNYVPLWGGTANPSTSLTSSVMHQTGSNIGIDTKTPKWALDLSGHINSSAGYRIGENLILAAPGSNSIAVGEGALNSNTGGGNTAVGSQALYTNTVGQSNAAVGFQALYLNNANFNAALGTDALYNNIGELNTAVGYNALSTLTNGTNNIGIGDSAGISAPVGVSNSIYIGSQGASGDANIIRIGTQYVQSSFYAAGIFGTTVGGAQVIVNANGQLGVASSSRRFKEDIQDMGEASSAVLRLRPVTFRYKQAYEDGTKPLDYGLIAEEVAEIYPDLAVKDANGQIQTIQYQKLTPMLLNELQKQAETIQRLEKRLETLEAALHSAR